METAGESVAPPCNVKAIVRYDGTDFAGWQVQEGRRTVQGLLQEAMARIACQPVRIQGASRTDAGVHALGQVFSCRWPGPFPERLAHALSRMLGPEVRVTDLIEVDPHFNARFSAKTKRYAYSLDLGREPDPFSARYAWFVRHRVAPDTLRELLPALVGRRDFGGFQSRGSQMENTVRTIFSATLERGAVFGTYDAPDLWRIEFYGDGFLYHMVRNLAGTLIEIARGRFPREFLDECLASSGPFRGHCAPAHGLTLISVDYDSSPLSR